MGDGHVYAFEPLPRNLDRLRRHLDLNKATNVTVVEKAVSDTEGVERLDDSQGHLYAELSPSGALEVETTTLDAVELPPPDCVKINIEGAELRALTGAVQTLKDAAPVVVLSTHGPTLLAGCCSLLHDCGYEVAEQSAVYGSEQLVNIVALPRRSS